MNKSVFAMIVSGLAVLATVNTASAGTKSTYTLYVSSSSRYAYASLGSVRNSTSQPSAYVNTMIRATAGQPALAMIWGTDGTTSFSCSSVDPAMVAAVQAMSGDGFFSVYWDTSGTCTNLQVENGSLFEPKQP